MHAYRLEKHREHHHTSALRTALTLISERTQSTRDGRDVRPHPADAKHRKHKLPQTATQTKATTTIKHQPLTIKITNVTSEANHQQINEPFEYGIAHVSYDETTNVPRAKGRPIGQKPDDQRSASPRRPTPVPTHQLAPLAVSSGGESPVS